MIGASILGVAIYFFGTYAFDNPDGAECWIGYNELGVQVVSPTKMYDGKRLVYAEDFSLAMRSWFKVGFWLFNIQVATQIIAAIAIIADLGKFGALG